MSRRFARLGDTGIRVTLSAEEVELLTSLPEGLATLYQNPAEVGADAPADPVRDRLFPRAYLDPTAEDAEAEWRALVHPELIGDRLAALERLRATLGAATAKRRGRVTAELTEDDVTAWLSVINDARLALGTRCGVTEETDFAVADPTDPTGQGLLVYSWLTELQAELIEALLPGLPG
jgi:hypothetical protein